MFCVGWEVGGFLEDQPRCYSLHSLIFDSLTWRNWEPRQHDRPTTLPMQHWLGAQIKNIGMFPAKMQQSGIVLHTNYIQLNCFLSVWSRYSLFFLVQIDDSLESFFKEIPKFLSNPGPPLQRGVHVFGIWNTSWAEQRPHEGTENNREPQKHIQKCRFPEVFWQVSFGDLGVSFRNLQKFWSLFPCRVCLVPMKIYFCLWDHEGWSR